MDKDAPMRAKLRNDTAAPNLAKSSTDSENSEAAAMIDSDDPRRPKLRSDKEAPSSEKPSTDTELPKLAEIQTAMAAPRRAKLLNDRDAEI